MDFTSFPLAKREEASVESLWLSKPLYTAYAVAPVGRFCLRQQGTLLSSVVRFPREARKKTHHRMW
jgi:hypothetical protein